MKFFIPLNIFLFEKSIPIQFTQTNLLLNKPIEHFTIQQAISSSPQLSQYSILFIGYFTIFAALSLIYIVKKMSVYSLISNNLKNNYRIIQSLKRIQNYFLFNSNIGIYQINKNFACTTGFLQKQIMLPQNILSKKDAEIDAILLHELVHVRNSDSLKLDFFHSLKNIFWFNPIFYILLKEIKILLELRCDETVMKTKMLSRKDYGMTIINFNNIEKEPVLNPNFAKSSKTLFLRIKQLKRRKKMKASMKFIMLFLAIILLMVNFDLSAKSNGEKFIKPIKIGYVSSRYGNRKHPFTGKIQHHNGIDIAAPNGTSLYAAKSGKVIFADFKKNYGNTIIIDHVNQKTVYTQMSKILVSNGDMVNQGQTIGKVGSSGISTGPHLHFEIRENDKSVNPENFIDFSAK